MVYQVISASFCVIVVLANILSAKMVMLPWIDLNLPAGVLMYPLTFLLSDLVTELYGARSAKLMVYVALAMSLLSFGMIQITLAIPGYDLESSRAFESVLGLSGLRIFASLISYVAAQLIDIKIYSLIKRLTGLRFLWLRNNASTFISQFVDTLMVDMIFLWWGLGMPVDEVAQVVLFSYTYKTAFGVLCTPFFYLLVFVSREKLTKWFELPV